MTRLVLGFLALAACGGGSSPAGGDDIFDPIGDDPGGGTNTLLVDGSASADPTIDNAVEASNFTTDFSVRVTRDGVDVVDGVVEVRSTAGAVALLYDTATNRWRGAQAGYFETYQLAVTNGLDFVDGVRVDGPDIHSFSSPTKGATVDSKVPLDVVWARGETADAATLRTREIDVSIADAGTYSIAANSLRAKPDQPEDERLELVRSQRITPAGAVVGSSWRVSIRNKLALVVRPTQ